MKWRPVHTGELWELVDFLIAQEWGCVPFTSRLRENGAVRLPSSWGRVYLSRESGDGPISGALLAGQNGLVFPVFREPQATTTSSLPRGYSSQRVYSIMGRDSYVRAVERTLRKAPSYRVDYYLMTLDGPIAARGKESRPGVHIRTASVEDIDRLFPLQKRYEREEVLLPNHRLNASLCYRNLREMLATQKVVVAEAGRHIVAKANTNGRGFRYDQVGGVFTERQYRNRGIAASLMIRLTGIIRSNDKRVCLFVKKDNPPALALYQRLGFTIRDDFAITYYG